MSDISLNTASEQGIVSLTFPLPCIHKLKPMDISVYGTPKGYYNDTMDPWMMYHPGKPVTFMILEDLLVKHSKEILPWAILRGGFAPKAY